MKITTTSLALQKAALWGMLLSIIFALYGTAFAQESEDFKVSTNDMTVTVTFTRGTPCTPYELTWGDGEEDVLETIEEACIQVIDEKTIRHTYEEEGEYTVSLTLQGETHTEEVTVPGEALTFDLTDVTSITSKWVDPYEMMADEEYYVYTIELESGETVMVEAGGFTTVEYRNQQFADAGYTGDVDALLMKVDESTEEEDQADDTTRSLQERLLALLQQLVALLQSR